MTSTRLILIPFVNTNNINNEWISIAFPYVNYYRLLKEDFFKQFKKNAYDIIKKHGYNKNEWSMKSILFTNQENMPNLLKYPIFNYYCDKIVINCDNYGHFYQIIV